MNIPKAISLVEATALVIEKGLAQGRWLHLPGERRLAEELEVGRSTLRQALQLLTEQGRIAAPAQGKRREPSPMERQAKQNKRIWRIGMVSGLPAAAFMPSTQRLMIELRHSLEADPRNIVTALPDLTNYGRRKGSLIDLVDEHPSDIWLITSANWEQLSFFCNRPEPALAIGGRSLGIDIASIGIDLRPALSAAVRRLVQLGHRRIVLLCEKFMRNAPTPGRILQCFHDELSAAGIQPSAFHVPEWDDSPETLQSTLTSLFRVTPPTAVIVTTTNAAVGFYGFCNAQRLRIPDDVSFVLVSGKDDDAWYHPQASVIRSEVALVIPPILRWISTCHQGRASRRQILLPTEFREGKTIAPPKGKG